jgi:hypothetical protein
MFANSRNFISTELLNLEMLCIKHNNITLAFDA